jgi:hypothetical protein
MRASLTAAGAEGAEEAQRLSAWALRSLRLCGEREVHQALLELYKLVYLNLNK